MLDKRVSIKGLFFAFAVILAFAAHLQTGTAATEAIFDGTALIGSEYNTSIGKGFTIDYFASEDKVTIEFPEETLIVKNKTCERGRILEGCVDEITFKGYNYTPTRREVYEFKIRISQILVLPDIKIGKSIEREELEVGEETTIFVNVTNLGPATTTAFFSEKIPPELAVRELPDQHCELSTNNTLSGKAELKEGQRLQCNYKVTALASGTYSLQSSATYEAVKTEKVEASVQLKVKSLPLSVDAKYNQKLILGDEFSITLLLGSDIKIDSLKFNAFIPNQIRVVSTKSGDVIEGPKHTSEKQKTGLNILNGDKLTSLNGSAEIIINSEAVAVGEFLISTRSSWSFDGLEQEMAKDFPVNVTFAKPYFRLNKYDNKTGQASIDVVNPAHLPIFNVSLAFNSFAGLNNQPLTAEEISSLSHASFDIVQKTPESRPESSSVGTGYNSSIRYHTKYGQELITAAALPINASQLPKPKAVRAVNETPPKASEGEQREQPTGEEDKTEKTGGNAIQEPVKPKRTTGLMNVKTGMIMAGVIITVMIILTIIFLMIRAKKGKKEEETELKAAEETEEKSDLGNY